MEPPLFVFAPDSLIVFPSARAAEERLDWRTVADGTFAAFDARGRRLELLAVQIERQVRGFSVEAKSVVVEDAEDEPTGQAELRSRLVAYLNLFDLDPAHLGAAALADLVRTAAERNGVRV